MSKRILSTCLLWIVLAGVLWFGRTGGAVFLVGVVAALTLREFYQLLAAAGYAPFTGLGVAFGALIAVAPWVEARFGPRAYALPALAAILFSIRLLGERPPEKRVEALMSTLFGLVYVGMLLQYLARIATPLPGDVISPDGRLLLCVWVVAVAKFCDVGALLTGLAIGRHKMSPSISPRKTWEGAAGGVALSMAVGAFVAWLGRSQFPGTFLTPGRAALLAAPVAAIAIVSDLIESVVKRRADSKDSGGVIPGIGGMFDLSDSLLLAAPVAYFLLRLP